ncbi:hypothetical protein ACEPPN_003094 [Leptodophora sp. 'Broadleaf-Isolate-01']
MPCREQKSIIKPSEFPETNPFRTNASSKIYLPPPSPAKDFPEYLSVSSASIDQKYPQQDLSLRNTNSSASASSVSSSQIPTDDELLSQALAFTQHQGHVPSQEAPISRPIAIPQTKPGLAEAFNRAWAPDLVPKGIQQADFLAFIDNLNVVATKNPPLQIVDLAGGIISMVPHHWFAIAGMAVQATAKLGTAVVSKGRTELYLREVNKKMFEPRGLKVSIASSLATKEILKVPGTLPKLAPLNDDTFYLSTAERALRIVEPYNKKNHKKIMKARDKAVYKFERREKKAERKTERQERKRERKDRKRGKDSESSERDQSSSDSEDESHNVRPSSKSGKGDIKMKKDKEEKKARKLLWIVIENI